MELHKEILSDHKINDTGLIPPFNFDLTEYHLEKLKKNIELKCSLSKQWGWKEPRSCLFIEIYRKLLPQAKYLVVYRDYDFVVDSLIRRDYIFLTKKYQKLNKAERIKHEAKVLEGLRIFINVYLSAWTIYNQNIYNLISALPDDDYIMVQYDKLIKNDKVIFEKLNHWGFKLNYHPFNEIFNPQLINESPPDITFNRQLENEALKVKEQLRPLLNQ